jgi:hypothetical protein
MVLTAGFFMFLLTIVPFILNPIDPSPTPQEIRDQQQLCQPKCTQPITASDKAVTKN